MKLIVEGINHRTTPLELREKLAVSPETIGNILKQLKRLSSEVALISTCNRVETYSVQSGLELLLKRLPGGNLLHDNIYRFENLLATRHMFRVSSGLDSMVTGETEIISQVKSAYNTARESGATSKILNKLFETSLYVAKKVHSSTRITDKYTSVPAVCANLAYKIFGDLNKRTLLIIGAGETAGITLEAFKNRNVGKIIIANRSMENAISLAKGYGAMVAPLSQINNFINEADVVLSCVNSNEYILNKSDIPLRSNPIFFIDIGVPRNINPDVNSINNAYLYNIDELEEIATDNKKRFERDYSKAEEIVEVESHRFFDQVKALL